MNTISEVITQKNLAKDIPQAKRFITCGYVRINGEQVFNDLLIDPSVEAILSIGKKIQVKLGKDLVK